MSVSLCLYCGAEGTHGLPAGHDWGLPCPDRGTDPCPTCGALRGELCTIADPASRNRGWPTADHARRPSPSLALDVMAPRTIANVTTIRR